MKKGIIILVVVAIICFGGYKIGMNYISEKMFDQVTEQVLNKEEIDKMMADPEIQKALQEQIGDEGLQKIQQQVEGETPSKDTPNPQSETQKGDKMTDATVPSEKNKRTFSTREEALTFLLSKFSMGELQGFASKAQGGLTSEEKAEIKSALMSRISPDEFEALKVLGLIEMSKKSQ